MHGEAVNGPIKILSLSNTDGHSGGGGHESIVALTLACWPFETHLNQVLNKMHHPFHGNSKYSLVLIPMGYMASAYIWRGQRSHDGGTNVHGIEVDNRWESEKDLNVGWVCG